MILNPKGHVGLALDDVLNLFPLTSIVFSPHTIEINGHQQLFSVELKKLIQVNDDRILIL